MLQKRGFVGKQSFIFLFGRKAVVLIILVLDRELKNAPQLEEGVGEFDQLMKIPGAQGKDFAIGSCLDDIFGRLLGHKAFVLENPVVLNKQVEGGFFAAVLNSVMTEIALVDKIKGLADLSFFDQTVLFFKVDYFQAIEYERQAFRRKATECLYGGSDLLEHALPFPGLIFAGKTRYNISYL